MTQNSQSACFFKKKSSAQNVKILFIHTQWSKLFSDMEEKNGQLPSLT